jgi:Methyltransferase domain
MDLVPYRLSASDVECATRVLNYQPFIITPNIQTGAAYSWVYGVNVKSETPLVFKREEHRAEWDKITDANARLRCMYDDFIDAIAQRYRGGSILDVACNNGYFPVRASLKGMKSCFGADGGSYFGDSVGFLNRVLGTDVRFISALYDPRSHVAPISGRYDVVCASAIMCHLPDPAHFLAFLGQLADEAIFYFGQVVDTDALLISYFKPHPALGGGDMRFPYRFNDCTRLSRGLLYHGFEEMGFKNIVQLPWLTSWLSPYFYHLQSEPMLPNEPNPDVQHAWRVNAELTCGSKHVAVLAMR